MKHVYSLRRTASQSGSIFFLFHQNRCIGPTHCSVTSERINPILIHRRQLKEILYKLSTARQLRDIRSYPHYSEHALYAPSTSAFTCRCLFCITRNYFRTVRNNCNHYIGCVPRDTQSHTLRSKYDCPCYVMSHVPCAQGQTLLLNSTICI